MIRENRSARLTQTPSAIMSPPWRHIATSIVAFSLVTVFFINLANVARANTSGFHVASAPRVYTPVKGTVKLAGVVDLAKAPKVTSSAQTSTTSAPIRSGDPLTPEQRQAYEQSVKANPQVKNPHPNTRSGDGKNPSFVGSGVTPLVTKSVDGLTSAQSGGDTYINPTIATDLSYVMEGGNSAVAIYRASTGALAYGPYAASSFFAPIYTNGDTFNYPRMYYDVMRDRWVVSMLQAHGGAYYIALAISVSNSPTQPSPGGQYYIYQLGTNFEPSGPTPSNCLYMKMGMDYWGVYFTCLNYRQGSVVGNTMLALAKAPMLSGGSVTSWSVNDGLQRAAGGPALATSPAIEEGVQDAEFFISTDSGTVSSNMGLCAWTNLSNITSSPSTVTCQNVNLGLTYDDAFPARQPGTSTRISGGFGLDQVYYKAGRLYFAQSIALGGDHDGIYWAEVKPQLTTKATHNPQWVNGAVVTQVAYFDYGSTYDLFNPVLIGTDENDIALVYSISGPSLYASIELTGRKASDADNTLGQGAGFVSVADGTHIAFAWGNYSACAISLNSVTRGGVWCAGQYTGSIAVPGWNTRLFNLRAE
ncbi:MAG TPA: hypothetical protein VHR15_06030 [Ktedonobacterales bacterium]|nr:hypothetical protein [Ktedonobacterales bacterium]